MRRFLLLLLWAVSMSVNAQKWVDLNRDFSLSGKLFAYTETETGEDMVIAAEGARWHLTNEFVAGRNHVKFWISMPDIEEDLFFTRWSADDIVVSMMIDDDKQKTYYVTDSVFYNLVILEKDQSYVVRNCSVLIDK